MAWQATIVAQPFVCPKCSRRFPRLPYKGNCPDHSSTVKVTDQSDLAATYKES